MESVVFYVFVSFYSSIILGGRSGQAKNDVESFPVVGDVDGGKIMWVWNEVALLASWYPRYLSAR